MAACPSGVGPGGTSSWSRRAETCGSQGQTRCFRIKAAPPIHVRRSVNSFRPGPVRAPTAAPLCLPVKLTDSLAAAADAPLSTDAGGCAPAAGLRSRGLKSIRSQLCRCDVRVNPPNCVNAVRRQVAGNQGPERPTHATGLSPDGPIRMAPAEPFDRALSCSRAPRDRLWRSWHAPQFWYAGPRHPATRQQPEAAANRTGQADAPSPRPESAFGRPTARKPVPGASRLCAGRSRGFGRYRARSCPLQPSSNIRTDDD